MGQGRRRCATRASPGSPLARACAAARRSPARPVLSACQQASTLQRFKEGQAPRLGWLCSQGRQPCATHKAQFASGAPVRVAVRDALQHLVQVQLRAVGAGLDALHQRLQAHFVNLAEGAGLGAQDNKSADWPTGAGSLSQGAARRAGAAQRAAGSRLPCRGRAEHARQSSRQFGTPKGCCIRCWLVLASPERRVNTACMWKASLRLGQIGSGGWG